MPAGTPTDVSQTSPLLIATRAALRTAVQSARRKGQSIGVVPTMGALHAGHLSLLEAARRECDFTVVTIFVNPAQFGPSEDFQRYPRMLEADLEAIRRVGADAVFAPELSEMYGPQHVTFVEMGGIAEPLEGNCRPGHFRGVATIVLKLFNAVMPDRAYFGQKDFQQTLVVRRMVADLDLPIEIRVCPIIREPDGLAMSSRNAYLSPVEREQALAISRSLNRATSLAAAGERTAEKILASMREVLHQSPGVELEYLVLVDPENLKPVRQLAGTTLAAIAAKVGKTRLIDNCLLLTD
jgi:pantoate--beta-alanine ligase